MRTQRKTTPKVKNGRVQKKNRHNLTPNYWNTRQGELQLDIEKPGKGYKHFLKASINSPENNRPKHFRPVKASFRRRPGHIFEETTILIDPVKINLPGGFV